MKATLQDIFDQKLIAIVRGISAKDMPEVARALLEGGIRMMEITYDHRSAAGKENTLWAIRSVNEAYGDTMYVGAGTVLSPEDVRQAHAAGASYIISPDTNAEVVRETKRLGMLSMPGALTPSEVTAAYAAGADIVKLFPSAVLGAAYIRAVRAPLAHIPMSAVGGVSPENLAEFYQAGACCFGIGGNLVSAEAVAAKDFAKITETAARFVAARDAL